MMRIPLQNKNKARTCKLQLLIKTIILQVQIINQANSFAKKVVAIWRENSEDKHDEMGSMDIPHCSSCSICLYYWCA